MNDKVVELITALQQKSVTKNVIWAKTNSESEFQVILDSGLTVTVDSYNGDDNWHYFDIGIYNNKGERVVYLSTNKRDSIIDYKYLESLYLAAKDSYFRVDETIDDILKEISLKPIVGKLPDLGPEDDDLPF